MLAILAAAMIAAQAGAGAPPRTFIMPPKAKPAEGSIGLVELSPIFAADFVCSEHYVGQIDYAGDALGTDCMITGGLDGKSGYSRPFRTDGRTNEDWYGWMADVLSPTDGVVVGVLAKDEANAPGTFGKPPAAMVQIRRDDGVLVTLGHAAGISVRVGDRVRAGQPIAKVGNNGFSRAPHIHIGAYRETSAEPLQIRWDLQAAAKLREAVDGG